MELNERRENYRGSKDGYKRFNPLEYRARAAGGTGGMAELVEALEEAVDAETAAFLLEAHRLHSRKQRRLLFLRH